MNSIQLFGVSLAALGHTVLSPTEKEGLYREQILNYPSSGTYQKLVFSGQKLVGILLVGDIRQAGVLYHKLGSPLTEGYLGAYSFLPGKNY
jgi:NAD(P)H-nitrite reductase large subunit